MANRKGFTFIEIMIVVAIIAILATAVLVSINESRKRARINSAKTSLRTILPAIVSCRDGQGLINAPGASEDGTKSVCNTAVGLNGAKWPALEYGYTYDTARENWNFVDSNNCFFTVNTNGDNSSGALRCSCSTQQCEEPREGAPGR